MFHGLDFLGLPQQIRVNGEQWRCMDFVTCPYLVEVGWLLEAAVVFFSGDMG